MNHNTMPNLIVGKPLKEFKPGDTLYMQKLINGMLENYLVRFERIERGNVIGTVISRADEGRVAGHYENGNPISAKPSKCFLWGPHTKVTKTTNYYFCHWFKNTTEGLADE